MTKILLYGVMPEYNFGGPSLMHGAREMIKEVNQKYEIVFYQTSKPVDIAVNDMGFKVLQIPYTRTSELLKDAFKYKYGFRPKNKNRLKFLEEIKNSDIVANLYGICFSSNFDKGKYSFSKAIKAVIGKYSINYIAKMYGVKSVKCTASYGPIISKSDIVGAKFAAKHVFDVMFAREDESRQQMEAICNKKIFVSPDIANLMPYQFLEVDKKIIGISISYQIIRQWKSDENYIDCIVDLIEHILSTTNYKVVLIPNEITIDNPYHDIHVANGIMSLLKDKNEVDILDITNMNASELKNFIASCEIMIASRYHSCVAALSAGVPTLIIGWHYKYDELLKWYGQSKWLLSSENCTSDALISIFNEFLSKKNDNQMIIIKNYTNIKKALIDAGNNMFSV